MLKQYAREQNKDQGVMTALQALQASGTAVQAKNVTRTRIDVWAALNWMHCGRAAC